MKIKFLGILFLLFSISLSYAQVGIGTTNPSPAAMLEVSGKVDNGSTYRGFMPPRVPTIADRNTINATIADVGLLIFLQSTNCLQMWNGSTWEDVYCVTVPGNSSIEYTAVTQSLNESDGGISFDFTIVNPSPTNIISVTITPANFDDIDETTSTIINIPAGVTSYTAMDVFTLTDDALDEGIETLDFILSAPAGGFGTIMLGTNTTQTIIINDNDGPALAVWINEFHYNNNGADTGEFVEVAGVAGTDLTGYTIDLYNGANGTVYNTLSFAGGTLIPDEGTGFGAIGLSTATIQNGNPDGIALVNDSGVAILFLSYGGTFTATNGSANSMISIDVGVLEVDPGTLAGESLQLTGTGSTYSDFIWVTPSNESPGLINANQTIN